MEEQTDFFDKLENNSVKENDKLEKVLEGKPVDGKPGVFEDEMGDEYTIQNGMKFYPPDDAGEEFHGRGKRDVKN